MEHNLAESKSDQSYPFKLSSKSKWFKVSLLVAIFSPLAGMILAVSFLTEKNFKREAKIILILSFLWLFVSAFLILWLKEQNYLPQYQYLAG